MMPFTEDEFDRYRLKPGDILLNEGQSIELVGRPAMYRGEPENCCFQNTLVRFRSRSRVNSDFALQLFFHCLYVGEFRRIAKQTTSIAHLGVSRFANLVLAWPPLPEQQKIAEILGTWDKAIAVANKLIENSKAQKKALMQQLLTGKRRLPGFQQANSDKQTKFGPIPEDWGYVAVDTIAVESGRRLGRKQSEIPVLACSKHVGFVDSLKYFKKKVFSDDLSGYKLIYRGEFGFPSNHIEEGSIGYQDLYDTGLVSPIYCVFGPTSDVHGPFLYAVFKTDRYRQIFAASTNASVDRRGSLRWKEFRKIKVPLPSIAEQKAIMAVLEKADRVVEVQVEYRDHLQLEKKALMQQLLTGQRRVRVETAA